MGTNAPLLVDDPKKDPRDDADFSNKVNDIIIYEHTFWIKILMIYKEKF